MAEEIKQWEYRVQTIGSVFGTKDENIEATLDAWGAGRLGNDQCLYSLWKRQNNHRRKTSVDGTRTSDEVIAANT